jgi:hypothetical protein
MTSQSTIPETQESSNTMDSSSYQYRCAAGIYCKLPLLDYGNSIHKCYFCQRTLHGPCGVPHDLDNITYQNHCQPCNVRYFQQQAATPSPAPHTPSPIPTAIVQARLARPGYTVNFTANQVSVEAPISTSAAAVGNNAPNTSILRVSSTDIISQLGSRTSTPTFDADLWEDDVMADCDQLDADIPSDDNISIPNWFELDLDVIYDHLNPRTKQGIAQSRSWRKKAVDVMGRPLSSIGIVANRLLKILITRKLIPDMTLNSKLQTRKAERAQQRLEFTRIGVGSNPQPAIMLIRKFLMENILVPRDADGNVVDVNNISANLGARIIMLAVDPDSFMSLNEIFAAPDKEARRAQIDDKSLSFNKNGMHWPVIFLMQMILIQKIFGQIKIPAFRM